MKKKILFSILLAAGLLPFSSFKSDKVMISQTIKSQSKQTWAELGEFTYGGQVYAVYGDIVTGVITAVDFFPSGHVYSWSGFYRTADKHAVVTVHPYNSTESFSYDGPLLFY